MKKRILRIGVVIFCFPFVIGCAVPSPRVPIINPPLVDQKEAKEKFLSQYCAVVVATNRMGFEAATTICRQLTEGQLRLAQQKDSDNGRYALYVFEEKGNASDGDYSIIAFSFNPGSDVIRSCHDGLCDVHVRNGFFQFGRSNFKRNGEPLVNDTGISITFNEYQVRAYDLLFSYGKGYEKEGNELISLFLSAFPSLDYQ